MLLKHEEQSGGARDAEGGRLLSFSSPFAVREAYVKLRTNLMFCVNAKGDPCTTFVLTSPNPSEGKSLTAANIAISLAMLGKKTLLIDADMRKPKQRKLWSVHSDSTGLCYYIANIGPLGLRTVSSIPLDIAFCGAIPPNPSELLSSTRMKRFLESARSLYGYVIVDTAPINTVADAQILSSMVDGVVLVARSEKTTTEELSLAVDAVTHAGGNLCGVVVNDLEMKVGKYSYQYKYVENNGKGGSNGYGYGYSSRRPQQ